jgi:hypothetical protein
MTQSKPLLGRPFGAPLQLQVIFVRDKALSVHISLCPGPVPFVLHLQLMQRRSSAKEGF